MSIKALQQALDDRSGDPGKIRLGEVRISGAALALLQSGFGDDWSDRLRLALAYHSKGFWGSLLREGMLPRKAQRGLLRAAASGEVVSAGWEFKGHRVELTTRGDRSATWVRASGEASHDPQAEGEEAAIAWPDEDAETGLGFPGLADHPLAELRCSCTAEPV